MGKGALFQGLVTAKTSMGMGQRPGDGGLDVGVSLVEDVLVLQACTASRISPCKPAHACVCGRRGRGRSIIIWGGEAHSSARDWLQVSESRAPTILLELLGGGILVPLGKRPHDTVPRHLATRWVLNDRWQACPSGSADL